MCSETRARTRQVRLTLTLSLVFGVLACVSTQDDVTKLGEIRRPNILWISVEDMSPWLGCYGDELAQTPVLDALAAEGLRYTQAHATSPVCSCARSTLITGCWATEIGSMHHRAGKPSSAAVARNPKAYAAIPSYEATPSPEVRCFPEILRAAGYYCTNAAKQDYQFRAPVTVWDESGGKAHWRNRPDPSQPFFSVINLAMTHESRTFPKARRAPEVTDPSRVSVPPYYPDTPLVRQDLARTYDNIAAMDERVGKILAQLDEDGLGEETVVFFFTDHGVGLPRGKRSLYASGTHVPLIVRLPGGQPETVERMVSFIDFAPTVLSLAGIEAPDWMGGRAFMGQHERDGREHVTFHADRMDSETDRTRAISDGRWRLLLNLMPERPHLYPVAYANSIPMMGDIKALQASGEGTPRQWQMLLNPKPARELYDTQSDPHEVQNLIEDPAHSERAAALEKTLLAWMESTRDLGLMGEGEMVRTQLWPPHGEQPLTEAPTLTNGRGLRCATPGASIGWREPGEKSWRVYQPSTVLPRTGFIQVVAHRIGFKPSERQRVQLGE